MTWKHIDDLEKVMSRLERRLFRPDPGRVGPCLHDSEGKSTTIAVDRSLGTLEEIFSEIQRDNMRTNKIFVFTEAATPLDELSRAITAVLGRNKDILPLECQGPVFGQAGIRAQIDVLAEQIAASYKESEGKYLLCLGFIYLDEARECLGIEEEVSKPRGNDDSWFSIQDRTCGEIKFYAEPGGLLEVQIPSMNVEWERASLYGGALVVNEDLSDLESSARAWWGERRASFVRRLPREQRNYDRKQGEGKQDPF